MSGLDKYEFSIVSNLLTTVDKSFKLFSRFLEITAGLDGLVQPKSKMLPQTTLVIIIVDFFIIVPPKKLFIF